MSHPRCASPLSTGELLEYWLDEMDARREETVEEHLLGCGDCAGSLQDLLDLGSRVHSCAEQGLIRVVVTQGFVDRLAARGLRLREYRVPRNGSVRCTIAPDDDLVITRLEVPLLGVERLDLHLLGIEGDSLVLADIPFEEESGEVLLAPHVGGLRSLPESTNRIEVHSVQSGTSRMLGEYTFHHTPWRRQESST
jgi:hypothetical protein